MALPHKNSETVKGKAVLSVHLIQALISLTILLIAVFVHNASAIETVHFTGKKVSLLPMLEFAEEREGETLDELLVRPETDWHHRDNINNNLGQTSHPIWARVRLAGVTESFGQPIVRLNYPH
ncbi:MAG: hypothetical protein VW258_12835, partial [Thalassolituus sp.]